MKPPPFRYIAPKSLDEAQTVLRQHGLEAKLLAGGQSLIPAMNFRLARPALVIDLNTVPGLAYILESEADGLRIGAMTRQSSVEKSEQVLSRSPLLAAAMPHIAHTQIRNRGTVGGSLAHADPAAELPAVMVALDAVFHLSKSGGQRSVRAADFYQGLFVTDLDDDELLLEVEIPPMTARTGWAIREVARRHGDYAMAGVAVRIALDSDDTCTAARMAFFGVGEGPARAVGAEKMLVGERLTDNLIREAVELAVNSDLDPHEDIHATSAYRGHLARVVGRDALFEARIRAMGVTDLGV